MGLGGSKDPRDRRRRQRQQRRQEGSSARGRVGGAMAPARRGSVVAVRHETNNKGKITTEVTEEAFDLPMPNGLGKALKTLRIKINRTREIDGPYKGSECVRSFVLSLVFRRTVEGLLGLPVSPTRQRKLRKIAYDRVSIEKIPDNKRDELAGPAGSGYDERGWRVNFWKDGHGKRRPGKRFSGRPVHTAIDELSVLEWIFNNGLEALYESPYLIGNRLLPKTDEQRVHEDGVVAGMKLAFGVSTAQPNSESSLHRSRLEKRLIRAFEGDELAALNALSATVIGSRTISREMTQTLPEQKFYLSRELGLAYALYNFPGMRYVMRLDLGKGEVFMEPLRVNKHGTPVMKRYQFFLENAMFQEIPWEAFQGLAFGSPRTRIVVE